MAFLALDYFPPNEAGNYCLPELTPENIEPYTPFLSAEQAMYLWWTVNKVRYTYSWYFNRTTKGIPSYQTIVVGEGSVVMSGGFDTMSEKVCPQVSYYTCQQNVIYSNTLTGEYGEVNDSVVLSIDSRPYKYNGVYVPNIALGICGGRQDCYSSWGTVTTENNNSGFVDFFGLFSLPLFPTVSSESDVGIDVYAVNIAVSAESTSEPV
jgi:hypothetical protein